MVTKEEAVAANLRLFETARQTCTLLGNCDAERQKRQRERCAAAMDYLLSGGTVIMIGMARHTRDETCIAVTYDDDRCESVAWGDDDSCPTVIWFTACHHAETLGVPFIEMVDGRAVSMAVIDDERKVKRGRTSDEMARAFAEAIGVEDMANSREGAR